MRRSRAALGYVLRGDWVALYQRSRSLLREFLFLRRALVGPPLTYAVLTPPHTIYLGHAIQQALARLGLPCEVYSAQKAPDFDRKGSPDFYFVIAAQTFKRLPAGERRVAFQVEQGVSDRWFDRRYLRILEESLAVFDYSRINLTFLSGRGVAYPHVYYVPAGGLTQYSSAIAEQKRPVSQVLFYGDASAPRRKAYLEALQARFDVRVLTNTFGSQLQEVVAQSAVVLNIHFYENALLETTRIFECLSLGARVISETALDVGDYPGLEGVVDFVPVGDVVAMVDAVERALAGHLGGSGAHDYLQRSEARFNFMFYRALLGLGFINYSQLFAAVGALPDAEERQSYALSLPETVARRDAFAKARPAKVSIFDGLRARPSWVGCALSYKYLCQSALASGRAELLVCEDDVELPPDFEHVLALIRAHLAGRADAWDIYAGLIAHLAPDVEVLDVQSVGGLTFVTLNKITSMVFNIYSPRAMQLISDWDESNTDPRTNTIDRYLESQPGLRVVTTLEPLFGHREDMHSSLWGFGNSQYTSLINESRTLLRRKVSSYQLAQGASL